MAGLHAASTAILDNYDTRHAPIEMLTAGCAKLSVCMQNQNFDVLPVGHDVSEHQPLTPTLFADLCGPAAQQMLVQRLDDLAVSIFAMPCGTESIARERAIPESKRKMEVPQPPLCDLQSTLWDYLASVLSTPQKQLQPSSA